MYIIIVRNIDYVSMKFNEYSIDSFFYQKIRSNINNMLVTFFQLKLKYKKNGIFHHFLLLLLQNSMVSKKKTFEKIHL